MKLVKDIYEGEKVKFFTDGVKTIKLKPGDEIPNGFYPGRTFNSNPWNKGLTAETDERVKANGQATRQTRLNNGSYVAWNKDLTMDTDERVAKNVSNTNATIQNITQQPDYQVWNKGVTKETDDRMKRASENHKGVTAWNKGLSIPGHPQSEETKLKISQTHSDPEFQCNRYITLKNNGTLYTSESKIEKEYYEKLKSEYGNDNVIRQYFDKERYPFKCDFYIPSEDLFIEINGNWTHGKKPYDSNDAECQEILKKWEEKSKEHPYYRNAIYTWTDLDVKKREYAKKNNLNYKVIYC